MSLGLLRDLCSHAVLRMQQCMRCELSLGPSGEVYDRNSEIMCSITEIGTKCYWKGKGRSV